MNKDDIIRMAREAWFPEDLLTDNMVFLLERFAAVEREACARLCEGERHIEGQFVANEFAAAIRARGGAE